MNPADIAASGLASPAMEVSLLGMFWSAHFVVKLVMVGLLAASVWCWAIIINKVLLFAKTNRAMAQFEDVFWSGASLDELYATLSSRPASGMAALFVAAMRNGGARCKGRPHPSWVFRRASRKSSMFQSRARSRSSNPAFWCWQRLPRRVPSSACSARSGAL